MAGELTTNQNIAQAPGQFTFQAQVVGSATKGHFSGIASSTSVSKQGDLFFSQAAQAHMQAQGQKPLSAGVDHTEATVNRAAVIGFVKNWGLSEDGKQLTFEGDIDPKLPQDVYDWYCSWFDPEVTQTVPVSVSVGGWVPKGSAKMVKLQGQIGEVKQIDALDLDHLLLCRGAAACNPDATIAGAAAPVDADWREIVGQAAAQMLEEPEAVNMAADMATAPVDADPDTDAGVADANAALGVDIDAVREMVRDALRQQYKVEFSDKSPYVGIEGLYVDEDDARSGTVHYEVWTPGGNEAQYIVTWALNEDGTDVTLGGSPVEVIVKELLVTPDGKPAIPTGQANHAACEYALDDAETLEFMADVTGQAAAVATGAWTNPTQKDRKTMPDSCFLYVDGDLKLFPVYEVGEDGKCGKINARALGAATRRLVDVKGHGAHTADSIRKTVEAKLKKLYKEIGKPLPPSLVGQASEGGSLMSNIFKTLAEAFGQAATAEGADVGTSVEATPEATGQAVESAAPEYVTVAQCSTMIKEATDPIGQTLTQINETLTGMAKAAKKKDDEEDEGKPDDEAAEGECDQAAADAAAAQATADADAIAVAQAAADAEAATPTVDQEFASVVSQAVSRIGEMVEGQTATIGELTARLAAMEARGKPTGQSHALPIAPLAAPAAAPAQSGKVGNIFDRLAENPTAILRAG